MFVTADREARNVLAWPGANQLSIAAARFGTGDLPAFKIPGTTREAYVWGMVHDDKRQVTV